MARPVSDFVSHVREAFEDYRAEVQASNLAPQSKATCLRHAETFVRWVGENFHPGARGSGDRGGGTRQGSRAPPVTAGVGTNTVDPMPWPEKLPRKIAPAAAGRISTHSRVERVDARLDPENRGGPLEPYTVGCPRAGLPKRQNRQ